MEEVFRFVEGKLSYEEFEKISEDKPEIWTWLQSLLDTQIQAGNTCLTKGDKMRLDANGNYVKYASLSFGLNSISHELISHILQGSFPNIQIHYPQENECNDTIDILEKLGMGYIGGPEVDDLIEKTLNPSENCFSGKYTLKEQRSRLKLLFHIVPRKVPAWVQEPEWPMGKNSPMEYLGRHKDGELVQLRFRDVDTGEEKVVEQFY